jgi:hypothetical protein
MKVRLKMAWNRWSKGHVFPDMPGGQARTLIARGIAEAVTDDKLKGKTLRSPANRMVGANDLLTRG